MDTSAHLQQMQNYVVKVLEQSGEFSRVERRYDFKDQGANTALREQARRQIYCELKPEYSPTDKSLPFLVVAHADTMSGSLLAEKMAAASNLGIHTLQILYGYANREKDESTHGPLFRRFLHEEDRTPSEQLKRPGAAAYRVQKASHRDSLAHYPSERRDNFRHVRDIERDWVPATLGGYVVYYHPKTLLTPERLQRYRWGNVLFRRDDVEQPKGYFEVAAVDIKESLDCGEVQSFTLRPALRSVNRGEAARQLEETILVQGKRGKVRFTFTGKLERGLLLAEVVGDEERMIREKIAAIESGGLTEEVAERIAIQMESFHLGHPLGNYLRQLVEREHF